MQQVVWVALVVIAVLVVAAARQARQAMSRREVGPEPQAQLPGVAAAGLVVPRVTAAVPELPLRLAQQEQEAVRRVPPAAALVVLQAHLARPVVVAVELTTLEVL